MTVVYSIFWLCICYRSSFKTLNFYDFSKPKLARTVFYNFKSFIYMAGVTLIYSVKTKKNTNKAPIRLHIDSNETDSQIVFRVCTLRCADFSGVSYSAIVFDWTWVLQIIDVARLAVLLIWGFMSCLFSCPCEGRFLYDSYASPRPRSSFGT